jgi:hypothetical protein
MAKVQSFLPVVAGAVIGWAAWGYGFTPLAALFFLAWGAAGSRRIAYLTALAYYLAGSRVIPNAAAVFFGENTSLWLGVALWLTAGALLALPWGLLHTTSPRLKDRAWRLVAALALVTLPPLGFVGWLNPILGTALIVPGWGAVSLLIGLVLALWLGTLPTRKAAFSTALAVTLIALVSLIGQAPTKGYDGWAGVTTHAGKMPIAHEERLIRFSETESLVKATLKDTHTRVVVLPEQHLGDFNKNTRHAMTFMLADTIKARGATVLIGAAWPTGEAYKTTNALMVFDGETWTPIHARFAVPVSMWKPWADDSTVINPTDLRIFTVAGKKVHVSMCFEDYMPWFHLGVLLGNERPDLIVASANGWWVREGKAQAIQDEHIQAWARIFDLPLVRAVNAS